MKPSYVLYIAKSIWGPMCWHFLHNSPYMTSIRQLYLIQSILPCPVCAIHLQRFLDQHQTQFRTVKELIFRLHNHVNTIRGHPAIVQKDMPIPTTYRRELYWFFCVAIVCSSWNAKQQYAFHTLFRKEFGTGWTEVSTKHQVISQLARFCHVPYTYANTIARIIPPTKYAYYNITGNIAQLTRMFIYRHLRHVE